MTNKIFIIGNLTRDPESGETQNGIKYCRFSIAVNRRFGKDGEVDFFNVVAWRGLADNAAKFLSKGKKAAVVGTLNFNKYTKDGVERQTHDLIADEIEFLSPADNSAGKPQLEQYTGDDSPF